MCVNVQTWRSDELESGRRINGFLRMLCNALSDARCKASKDKEIMDRRYEALVKESEKEEQPGDEILLKIMMLDDARTAKEETIKALSEAADSVAMILQGVAGPTVERLVREYFMKIQQKDQLEKKDCTPEVLQSAGIVLYENSPEKDPTKIVGGELASKRVEQRALAAEIATIEAELWKAGFPIFGGERVDLSGLEDYLASLEAMADEYGEDAEIVEGDHEATTAANDLSKWDGT